MSRKDLLAETLKAYRQGFRYIIHEGGTRSGKTHSILSSLYHIGQTTPQLISVVSETMPHLRRGAMRDFTRSVVEPMGTWKPENFSIQNSTYSFPKYGAIEFFSADSADKVHGPERDILFLNEAQNIDYETARHLFVRTRKTIIIDFNPTRQFWAHDLKDTPGVAWFHSTYTDNPFLPQEQKQEIERNKTNARWWQVYGEGRVADTQGAVYQGWQLVDDVPSGARLERYGLDFGYTNDPTAVIAVYRFNEQLILDEIVYRKGMHNKQIADILLSQPSQELTIADSAEPKSIDELLLFGANVYPSTKGPGSVSQGIDVVSRQNIAMTKRSTNLISEYRNYVWKRDKDGVYLNTPEAGHDHAMDAIRYAITDMEGIEDDNATEPKETRLPGTYAGHWKEKEQSQDEVFYQEVSLDREYD